MLVVPADGDAVLVIPTLEAPRVVEQPEAFELFPWDETDDPIEIVAGLVAGSIPTPRSAAIGDHTWARFVLDLQRALPDVAFRRATDVTGPLRVVKDAAEIEALRAAAARRRRHRRGDARASVRRSHRARRAPRAGRAHARGRARAGQLRHRRRGRERREPAPRPERPGDRARRRRAVRLRRHDARLLLRHHAHVRGRRARPRGARRVRRARRGAGGRRAGRDRRHAVRGGRRRRPRA